MSQFPNKSAANGTSQVTQAVRAGIECGDSTGCVAPPLHLSATFAFRAFGERRAYDYTRSGNPTRTALETALAALDGGTHALAFASGLAAESTALMLLSAGDHVIGGDDAYGGTYRPFPKVFARLTRFNMPVRRSIVSSPKAPTPCRTAIRPRAIPVSWRGRSM